MMSNLSELLDPKSIAIIGASEDQTKFGGRLFKNLLGHGFRGTIYPINAGRAELFGVKAYPDLASLPQAPDAFALALPSHLVKDQVEAAAGLGVKLGIIISSGFSDVGDEGRALEEEIVAAAHRTGMRLIGPNCLGVISAERGVVLCSSPILNRDSLPKHPIGFVSQSGALMTTLFDRAWTMGFGFTHGFSVGNQADLEICDFIDFLVDDQATSVVCAYIEGLKNPQRFLASVRRARAAAKPVLIVKAGRSQAGQEAAFSHTASIAGDTAVFSAVCRQEGVLVVDDVNIMLSVANMLATQPHRVIRSLAIVSPSGGGGALAADALADYHLPLARLGEAARNTLANHYPAGQIKNPIDFGTRQSRDESISADDTGRAVQEDPSVDATLCVMAMAPIHWQLQMIESQVKHARAQGKPIIVAFDAGATSDPVRERLVELGIPYANSTLDAVKTLAFVKQWGEMAPTPPAQRPAHCPSRAHSFAVGQYDEHQTKAILADYGVSVNAGEVATSPDRAVAIAERLGFPVVMKIVSKDVVHKSDVGGVLVGLDSADQVRTGYQTILDNVAQRVPHTRIDGVLVQCMLEGHLELIVGGRHDATFGPVVLFGAGGVLVELLPDKFLATAPMSADAVRKGLDSLVISRILNGYRGRKLPVDALVDTIVRMGWLMHDLKDHAFEIDLNPVMVGTDHVTAVDARLMIRQL